MFSVCVSPPKVVNSDLLTIKTTKLFDGSLTHSTVQYKCKEGYLIDDESNSITNCAIDRKWDLLELPTCLKGS